MQGTASEGLFYVVLSGNTSPVRQRPGKNGVSHAAVWESTRAAGTASAKGLRQASAWPGGRALRWDQAVRTLALL